MALYITTGAAAPLFPRFAGQLKEGQFTDYTGEGDFDVVFVPPPIAYRSVIAAENELQTNLWALYAETIESDASAAGPGANLIAKAAGFPGRVVISPTGPIHRGQDDVRRVRAAVIAGVDRLRKAGRGKASYTVVVAPSAPGFAAQTLAVSSAIGHAVWCPVTNTPSLLGPVVVGAPRAPPASASGPDVAILYGQALARALIDVDPVNGSPSGCAAYAESAIKRAFALASASAPTAANYPVNVSILKDRDALVRVAPLLAAVGRCSYHTPEQAPVIVHIGIGPVSAPRRIFVVGKGVTYDTGGADLKTGGAMVGMHRDKGGAAGALGVAAAAVLLQRTDVRVEVTLCFVRNSIGSASYTPDEIITAASGRVVRVVNTDAEGRMAMSDSLYHAATAANDFVEGREAKQAALLADAELVFEGGKDAGDAATGARSAHTYTFATLTGHVIRAYGLPYVGVCDNGAARAAAVADVSAVGANRLAVAGDLTGEPMEVSTLRPEDYAFIGGEYPTEEIRQGNSAPSTMTSRGHQFPAAFMDEAAKVSARNVPYTHLDIAGATLHHPQKPTGSPVAPFVLATLAPTFNGLAAAGAEATVGSVLAAQFSPSITSAAAPPAN